MRKISMFRTVLLGCLAILPVAVGCSSSNSTDGGVCIGLPNVASTSSCASCLSSKCSSQESSYNSNCSSYQSCACGCTTANCIISCATSVSASCSTPAENLETCAATSCASDCAPSSTLDGGEIDSGPTTTLDSGPTTVPDSGPTTVPDSGPTTVPDSGPTTEPDSGPTTVDAGGSECWQILDCLNQAGSNTTAEQTCINEGSSSGVTDFTAVNNCVAAACPADGGACSTPDSQACGTCEDNTQGLPDGGAGACTSQWNTCYTGSCTGIIICLNSMNCTTQQCQDNCVATGITPAQTLFNDIITCLNNACTTQCGASGSQTACDTCSQQAQEPADAGGTGACVSTLDACFSE